MRTSYSAIGTYLQCPQKYKFQEIDRIRAPKSKEAVFGTLIHSTLKFMFKRDPLFPTLDEVIDYYRSNWSANALSGSQLPALSQNENFLNRQWTEEEEKAYFEEGARMLKKFYEKNAPWNFSVVDLESRFEVALQDEKTGETHILAGIIDRIDKLPDETYEIIDYKTSKRMPSQDALDQDLQLSLYSLGLQKRWPHLKPEDIKLSLYFLKHGEKLSTKAKPDTTERTKNHILKTISEIQDKIREKKEFEPMPGPLCDWCAYKPMCPAWKHLYRKNDKLQMTNDELRGTVKEYFELKKSVSQAEDRLKELQQQVKDYMEKEGLTRVFGDGGVISKKIFQRYEYDWEKIKSLLSPIGKWEEVLKIDDTKLKKVLKEIPAPIRDSIEETRSVIKEYTTLSASSKHLGASEEDINKK